MLNQLSLYAEGLVIVVVVDLTGWGRKYSTCMDYMLCVICVLYTNSIIQQLLCLSMTIPLILLLNI